MHGQNLSLSGRYRRRSTTATMISFGAPCCIDCGEESVSLCIEVEAVKDGSWDARGIDDVDVPLGCAEALCKVCLDVVLEDGKLVSCTEVRNSLFGTREVDQNNVGVSEFFAVVVDDFLQLRSLRMTMRSGGLREVDNENGSQKLITIAFGAMGC